MVVTINYILDKIVQGQPYNRNDHVELTCETFYKEPHIKPVPMSLEFDGLNIGQLI